MADNANVQPTVDLIKEMAATLDHAAKQLRSNAERMKEDGDLTRAAEALNIITNLMPSLRLDLLVTRPLRACGKI